MDTDKYKKILEEEKDKLLKELEGMAATDDVDSNDWRAKVTDKNINQADPLEVADEVEDLIEDNAVVESFEARLREVEAALERIENGTYGIDEVDGEPIPIERLDANPAARTKVENVGK